MLNKKLIAFSSVAIVAIVLTPIAFYIWYFRKFEIVSDPQAWGVLGDYFGGILNPIISLASLGVLSYFTFLVAKQTNRESKNIFILERRMVAFDELARHVKLINSLTERTKSATSLVPLYHKLPAEQALQHMLKVFEELKAINNTYTDFYYTLFEFNPRYGHLFKYDFNSQEYKDLLTESKEVGQLMSKLLTDHDSISTKDRNELTIPIKFAKLLFSVFTKIRSEINIQV
jgi:hypothetical protein